MKIYEITYYVNYLYQRLYDKIAIGSYLQQINFRNLNILNIFIDLFGVMLGISIHWNSDSLLVNKTYTIGAGCRLEVECSLMVRWVIGSILHGVDPLSYFSFQPVLHDWCNKGSGMCYPVCGMVHIKEP